MASVSEHENGHIQLPSELCAELFDPGIWTDVLETFARTIRVAVALTDSEGHILGACHNPQPIWALACEARPDPVAGCSFCLSPQVPCTAVGEAIKKGEIVMVNDGAGLAHVAVPLSLHGRYLGGLIAGQVFDRYPESLRMQRAAKELGIAAQQMWQVAIRQPPISRATLGMYGELLQTFGQAFIRQRYGTIVEKKLNETNRRFRTGHRCADETGAGRSGNGSP